MSSVVVSGKPRTKGRRRPLAASIVVLTATALTACGSPPVAETVTVTTTTAARATTTTAVHHKAHRKAHVAAMRSCDANIRVKRATTSCAFAENVFYAYWLNEQEPGVFADSPGLPAYSPAVDETFYAKCSTAGRIICRAGDGAVVTFPAAAVERYTTEDAERYADAAHLGDVPAPESYEEPVPAPDDETLGGTADGGCDPNYEGACLDPNSPDYDCEGGSGDGPDYTGPVTVIGDDPFDLDRDGDGSACEPY
jgi:hypothetical protein